MSFAERDDLPSANGVEGVGPLGSLALHEGTVVRIPYARSGGRVHPAVVVDDAAPLRDAARLVAEGFVFINTGYWQHEVMTEWVEAALGPRRAACPIGNGETVLSFDGVTLLLMERGIGIACAARKQLVALLAHPLARKRMLEPARYSYESRSDNPSPGGRLGSIFDQGIPYSETLDLYETETGYCAHGMLNSTFETLFEMKPGGAIATVPRHPERFPRASAFGEWQPGLRNVDGLRSLLAEHKASEALTLQVIAADELVGGFRGVRGIELLAPWAGCAIMKAAMWSNEFWDEPRHPYNKATWFLGWASIEQYRAKLYVDETGRVWTCWQGPGDDLPEFYLVGDSVEGWFNRQLFLLEHGYASDAMCRSEETLPPGLRLREDLSDAVAKVYEDGDAAWLVQERGIQRMSRHVPTVADVIAIAAGLR